MEDDSNTGGPGPFGSSQSSYPTPPPVFTPSPQPPAGPAPKKRSRKARKKSAGKSRKASAGKKRKAPKRKAAKRGRIVAVEGYTDVLALHQGGITESVAIMGTAVTQEQLAEDLGPEKSRRRCLPIGPKEIQRG